MRETNIFFGSNVKFLRLRQKLTQKQLALNLGISRSKLNCIEIGQTKSPSIDDMLNFSSCFKISIDTLIKIDLSKLGELKLRELEAGNDIYIRGGNLRILAVTTDKSNNENVEYIPIRAKAGYKSGYNDPEFIAALPKYSLPNLPKQGTFRIFPTEGDSMLPIPEKSDITAQYVEDWTSLKPETICVVMLNEHQDFVFKKVTLLDEGIFLLKSLNEKYEPYTVHASEVLEIWKFHSYTTKEIPIAGMNALLYELQNLKLEIEKAIK